MIRFSTTILKFNKKGEKTGWSYIEVSPKLAEKLNPGQKVSYRVKGLIDQHPISKVALLPMGEGGFIIPFNATIRKGTGKDHGSKVTVSLELDKKPLQLSKDLLECLEVEPDAMAYFKSLPKSHQFYFSKWIDSAKTRETKAKRITMTLVAMANKQGYSEMMRVYRDNKLL